MFRTVVVLLERFELSTSPLPKDGARKLMSNFSALSLSML